MAEKHIRIGKISKIDYENGMAEVTYPDMDNAVTAPFPILSLNDEYKAPLIGEEVLVYIYPTGQPMVSFLDHTGMSPSRRPYPEKRYTEKNFPRHQVRHTSSLRMGRWNTEVQQSDTSALQEPSRRRRF